MRRSASERVETELLTCFLERGLVEMPTMPEPASRKSKKATESAAPNAENTPATQTMSTDAEAGTAQPPESTQPST